MTTTEDSVQTAYKFINYLATAKRFVDKYPLVSQPPEARIFMHAMLDYFKELGVSEAERDRILAAYTEGSVATAHAAFGSGWCSGYECGKRKTAPPF